VDLHALFLLYTAGLSPNAMTACCHVLASLPFLPVVSIIIILLLQALQYIELQNHTQGRVLLQGTAFLVPINAPRRVV